MPRVIFLNENALGHSSYLPAFRQVFDDHPEWGFQVEQIDVAPLPEHLEKTAGAQFPGAVRLGLSPHYRRWREVASSYAISLLEKAFSAGYPDALVVNTQSVALGLSEFLPAGLPLLVCLDATFQQLRPTPWFARNSMERYMQTFHYPTLLRAEQKLYSRAQVLLPWSSPVAASLQNDYAVAAERIQVLPPSVRHFGSIQEARRPSDRFQILFIGGDFARKGGPLLLNCFRKYFQDDAELHIVTHTSIPQEKSVFIHRGIQAWSPSWLERWRQADLFVFPSLLETFGIVLLEAQSFGVPVISSKVGAAVDILQSGQAGWLLASQTEEALRSAIQTAIGDPEARIRKAQAAQEALQSRYSLEVNASKLCCLLNDVLVQS